MAFSCPKNETENFNCVKVASVDLIKRPLADILFSQITPVNLFHEIDKCSTLFSGKYKLRKDQLNICYIPPPTLPDYGRFDVTLLYTLIRNLCSSLKPTQGWGIDPKSADIQIGDDVERLRHFRNNYFAHANSSKISDTEFGGIWRNLKSAINRIQSSIACGADYEQQLNLIEQTKYTREHLENCKLILEAKVNSNADEQEVVIKGDDEVICGETACFEADIENVDSSQSIRWRKRNGRLIEWIDKSTRKYSGSNNRKLVIQDVCKEDEGEYCAILSGDINGNEYENIRRNTICLHIIGEKPQIKDLKVTTENGDITIYCIFEVLIKSPKAHYIAWSKNDQTQNTKNKQCIGGSIYGSCFPITLPSERDIGKYTCTVTNAIGSVSRDVKLDVPNVKILFDPIFKFGSKATITTEVSSIPSPEKLEWQKSKDGIKFHCIDIKNPKYYGSSEKPECPMLVILKIDFADKLHYRLVVWNIFGESISNTVFLDVKGSPPNITTSQETDIQNECVKLIGNVFLYEGSPDILEVFWTKDSKRIDTQRSGGKYLEVTIENPSLTIRQVNKYDAGNYQLTATNVVGSTSSNVIVLGIPNVTVKKRETQEDDSTSFVVTIESFPAPFAVQWMLKDKYTNTFSLIDVSDENYMGTINTLPNPVLVVKNHTQLRNNMYQIKITNYVGSTVKKCSCNVIGDQNLPGNGLRGDQSLPGIGLGGDQSLPGNGSGRKAKERRKKRFFSPINIYICCLGKNSDI